MVIAGLVGRSPKTRHSPAGIPITRFPLQHRSQQTIAGLNREVQCQIEVVASGAQLNQVVSGLDEGSKVRVNGVLSRASHRDEAYRLVLHADRVEVISE